MPMETSSGESLPVVIVGGGFAGVTLAQHLEKQLDNAIEIIVISRDNHLVFTPMLPEVAARTISPLHVVVAGRQMTKHVHGNRHSICAVFRFTGLCSPSANFTGSPYFSNALSALASRRSISVPAGRA